MKYALTKGEKGELAAAIRQRIAFLDDLYQQHSIEAGAHGERTDLLRSALAKLGLSQ